MLIHVLAMDVIYMQRHKKRHKNNYAAVGIDSTPQLANKGTASTIHEERRKTKSERRRRLGSKSIECFIEDQAFSPSYDWLLPRPPPRLPGDGDKKED